MGGGFIYNGRLKWEGERGNQYLALLDKRIRKPAGRNGDDKRASGLIADGFRGQVDFRLGRRGE